MIRQSTAVLDCKTHKTGSGGLKAVSRSRRIQCSQLCALFSAYY